MISMCVLSYERPSFLKDTLRTMIATATEPLEIIVHDDGSTDPYVNQYLLQLVANGGISHLMVNPRGHNEGQGVAVNRMFGAANGDILVKCDQDIMFSPGWDKAIKSAFEENAKVVSDWCRDHEGEDLFKGSDPPDKIGALGLFRYEAEPVRFEDTLIRQRSRYDEVTDFVGSVIAVPRKAWDVFGPFEERSPAFAEDAVFKARINESPTYCCALTAEDQVRNIGFGPGPSTVVERNPDTDAIEVHKIKTGPKLVERIVG